MIKHLAVLLAAIGVVSGGTATRAAAATKPTTRAAAIEAFEGEDRFLSNFWPAEVVFERIVYPSVEHAYQSAKTLDRAERKRIAAIADPGEAKRAGRALTYRPDWEAVKFDVMEQCVRYKFTHHADLRAKLLAT